MMQLNVGARLQSTTDTTEVLVIRAPSGEVDLRCGGHPMVLAGDDAQATGPAPGHVAGTAIGKRYTDEEGSVEVLCTRAGEGSLSVGEEALATKVAKPLPSSD